MSGETRVRLELEAVGTSEAVELVAEETIAVFMRQVLSVPGVVRVPLVAFTIDPKP